MSIRIGRRGDLLAAAILEGFGADVSIVNRQGCDLLARYNEQWIRVEVKATQRMQRERRCYTWKTSRGNNKKHYLTNNDCDVVALVALDARKAVFRNVNDIHTVTTHLFEQKFLEIDERESWDQACAKLTS
tara:strand:- start:433 stop:825 length:393 start_codon:yes stop_codon:yes gene_type:complete